MYSTFYRNPSFWKTKKKTIEGKKNTASCLAGSGQSTISYVISLDSEERSTWSVVSPPLLPEVASDAHGVDGHKPSTAMPKGTLLWGLEMESMGKGKGL